MTRPASFFPTRTIIVVVSLGCVVLVAAGCSDESRDKMTTVDLDKRNATELLKYYVGSFVDQQQLDSLVRTDDGSLELDVTAFNQYVSVPLVDINDDNVIDWDELRDFVQVAYNQRTDLPELTDELLDGMQNGGDWLKVATNGVMTDARRVVFVKREAVRRAVESFAENDNRILYDIGTTFIGRHYVEDDLIESTAMVKREDGYWDYVVYDSLGARTSATSTAPKSLSSPTQCVGCHFGSRQFEPEKSFPAAASPGPSGPRGVHVSDKLKKDDVVRYFDEHRKRSDRILGLYATLYVSELIVERESGSALPDDLALLDRLGL